jgi:putative transcriptional regulator
MKEQTVLKNRVRELRTRLDLRQSDLAREIGVTRQTILAIEKGRLNPSINIALKTARVLREPVDYVFYLDHSSNPIGGSEIRKEESLKAAPPLWNLGQPS